MFKYRAYPAECLLRKSPATIELVTEPAASRDKVATFTATIKWKQKSSVVTCRKQKGSEEERGEHVRFRRIGENGI